MEIPDTRSMSAFIPEIIPLFPYAYVEHKDLLGMTGKFVAGNILDQHDWLRRDIYQPNRLGTIVRSVARTRQFAPIFTFELHCTF